MKQTYFVSSLFARVGLLAALLLPSCGWGFLSSGPTESAPSIQLTVSAAASLQTVLEEIEALYQPAGKPISITYNFGGSGALAQQIIQGAPVDVFVSASPDWMDRLEQQQRLNGARVDLMQNSLVLVVPKRSLEVAINDFQDLRSDQVKRVALGEPNSVPVGRYAKEVLEAMDLWEALQQRLVFGKSVRQVLAYVETGAVDAGLVYGTDAQASERVSIVVEASEQMHSPIVYSVGAIASGSQSGNPAALDFVAFLKSDAAIAVFEQYGFARIR